MRVTVTGANGFVGKNLIVYLQEQKNIQIDCVTRNTSETDLHEFLDRSDFVFHLAGENRPDSNDKFYLNNSNFTKKICSYFISNNKKTPILYTSSIQSSLDNDYGKSKKQAEEALESYAQSCDAQVFIYKLPNIFGKWSRPNYNSVVATFCYNVINNLPIINNAPEKVLELVYVDDVIKAFGKVLKNLKFSEIEITYKITLRELEEQIKSFKEINQTHVTLRVGTGLTRALYSTYLSFLNPSQFSYGLVKHEDPRGVFVEMLKTQDSGQFSYFTAHPGITRGGHYHHSKNEKFLVIKGKARFGFRHILSNEYFEIITDGKNPEVVETVPGWTHDITNIGTDEMIVMLWANEIFDRENPDTFACKVK